MSNKTKKVIISLLTINIFLLCIFLFTNNKTKKLNKNIEEKKLMVEDIDSKIESLQKTIDEVVIDNINVEKEYKVWIHQNEKLENILH